MKRYTLVGVDGNAFCVMGYVINAMKETERPLKRPHVITLGNIDSYKTLAMSGDYNNLLSISMDVLNDINTALEDAGLISNKKISAEEASALLSELGYEVDG